MKNKESEKDIFLVIILVSIGNIIGYFLADYMLFRVMGIFFHVLIIILAIRILLMEMPK